MTPLGSPWHITSISQSMESGTPSSQKDSVGSYVMKASILPTFARHISTLHITSPNSVYYLFSQALYFSPRTTLRSKYYNHPHLTEEKTERYRDAQTPTHPNSPRQVIAHMPLACPPHFAHVVSQKIPHLLMGLPSPTSL